MKKHFLSAFCLLGLTASLSAQPFPAWDKTASVNVSYEDDKAEVGKEAKNFILIDAKGEKFELAQHKGKVIMLDFSAVFCKPCNEEATSFNRFYEFHLRKGNPFVCATCLCGGAGPKQAEAWTSKHYMTMPVLVDFEESGGGLKAYVSGAFPTYVVIDKDFIVRELGVGNFGKAKRVVNQLFGLSYE